MSPWHQSSDIIAQFSPTSPHLPTPPVMVDMEDPSLPAGGGGGGGGGEGDRRSGEGGGGGEVQSQQQNKARKRKVDLGSEEYEDLDSVIAKQRQREGHKTYFPPQPPMIPRTKPASSSSSSTSPTWPSTITKGKKKPTTICTVCLVESDNHHVHYGALACFSCRAFFRRAHNTGTAPPEYRCKKENRCDVSRTNRKKCQRCRYQRCLNAGMRADLVLNEDQKKVRFRKMIEKKGTMAFGKKRRKSSSNTDDAKEDEAGGIGSKEEGMWNLGLFDDSSSNIEADTASTSPTKMEDTKPVVPVSFGLQQQPTQQHPFMSPAEDAIGASMAAWLSCGAFGGMSAAAPTPNFFYSPSFPVEERKVTEAQQHHHRGMISHHHYHYQPHNFFGGQTATATSTTAMTTITHYENFLMNDPSSQELDDLCQVVGIIKTEDNSDEGILAKLKGAYSYASSIVSLDRTAQSNLISFHTGCDVMTPADLRSVFSHFGTFFRHFASRLNEFTSLPQNDQRRLLEANKFIFIHYNLSKYLSERRGASQVPWLLGRDLTADREDLLGRVSLDSFMKQTGLLKGGSDLTVCKTLLRRLRALETPRCHSFLVAGAILFFQSENLQLEASKQVQEEFDKILDAAAGVPSLPSREKLEMTLDIMVVTTKFRNEHGNSDFVDRHYSHSEINPSVEKSIKEEVPSSGSSDGSTSPPVAAATTKSQPATAVVKQEDPPANVDELGISYDVLQSLMAKPPPNPIPVPYTREEEDYLQRQLCLFKEAYDGVSLGDDLVNEFVMYTFEVPLSKHYLPALIRSFLKRAKKICEIHQEIRDIPGESEREVVGREGCYKAAALLILRGEAKKSGEEQLKFCQGKEDRDNWEEKLKAQFSTQLKKVLITDWNRTANSLNARSLMSYLNLSANLIRDVIMPTDDATFAIVVILSLLRGPVAMDNMATAELASNYDMILRRRIISSPATTTTTTTSGSSSPTASTSASSPTSPPSSRMSYFRIKRGLETLDELAGIFHQLEIF